MKTAFIQGAGIAGLTAAIALSRKGWQVTVAEQRKTLSTDGAGILLYHNALVALKKIRLHQKIIDAGWPCMGYTHWLDNTSTFIGQVKYPKEDPTLPAYVGINRQAFLEILEHEALLNGAEIRFSESCFVPLETSKLEAGQVDTYRNTSSGTYDLVVAADGVNSALRQALLPDVKAKHSGFSLWHSMHDRHPNVTEKITVAADCKRLGIIPMSDSKMYFWASIEDVEGVDYSNVDHRQSLKDTFKDVTGYVGEVIQSINFSNYIHFAPVKEVMIFQPWYKGRVVFIGDAAHASTPFLAQGGAMAIEDALALAEALEDSDLDTFTEQRREAARLVQTASYKVGTTYRDSSVDLKKVQAGVNHFYSSLAALKA